MRYRESVKNMGTSLNDENLVPVEFVLGILDDIEVKVGKIKDQFKLETLEDCGEKISKLLDELY